MELEKLIKEKFGSIDQMIKETDIKIGRTYLYLLVDDEETNPSLNTLEELARVLEVPVETIIKAIQCN